VEKIDLAGCEGGTQKMASGTIIFGREALFSVEKIDEER